MKACALLSKKGWKKDVITEFSKCTRYGSRKRNS